LYLHDNKLSFLHPNLFKDSKSLERLDISANPFKTICANLLQNLKNLRAIGLVGTPLSTLPATLFENNTNLGQIVLSAGRITRVSNEMFSHLKKLKLLNFEDNFCASKHFNRHNSSIQFTEDMLLPCSCPIKAEEEKMSATKQRNLLICLGVVGLVILLITVYLFKTNRMMLSESGRFISLKRSKLT
jgi:Leucine-rich repeat (LRR) protein